jgi:hypothetical protein
MNHYGAIYLAIFALIVGAMFYSPLAALLGEGVRALLGLGAAGGTLYLIFRFPWDALRLAVIFMVFGFTIWALVVAAQSGGFFAGALAYGVSTWASSKALDPFLKWIDRQKKS